MQNSNFTIRQTQLVNGSSLYVNVPKALADSVGIQKGAFVKVSQDGNRIIIEKVYG